MALTHEVQRNGRRWPDVRTTHSARHGDDPGQPGGMSCFTFATTLRRYRKRSGMSQSKLGLMAGYDHSHVNRLEQGNRGPSHECVMNLAAVLDLSERDTLRLMLAAGRWPYHGELSDEAIERIMEVCE